MDRLVKGITEHTRIRMMLADVTMTAKALEARHLSGPVAGAVLGEALAAAALLAADAGTGDEAWMLRMNTSGPIEGVLVEATGAGQLRGFTNRKTLDDLDGVLPVDTVPALGESGSVQVVSTLPGRILSQAVLNVNPPQLRYVLGRYYNHSMQVPTGCNIWVVSDDGGIHSARAMLVQRMEDSDQGAFVKMLERLEDGHADTFMRERLWPKDVAAPLQDVFSSDPVIVRDEKSLAFGCRCNKKKVLGVLASLSKEELDVLIGSGQSQDVTCHMCGQTYTADASDLREVLKSMAKSSGSC